MCIRYSTRNSKYIMIIFCDILCWFLLTSYHYAIITGKNKILYWICFRFPQCSFVSMLLPSVNRYVWVFGRACGILFLYEKLQKSKYRLLETLQLMAPPSVPKRWWMKRQKSSICEIRKDFFSFLYLKNLCTSFFLIKFYDLRCQNPFEDWLNVSMLSISAPFKTMSVY